MLEVRAMAAYALGQIGSPKAETPLIAAFTAQDTLSVNNMFNRQILEALGDAAVRQPEKYCICCKLSG